MELMAWLQVEKAGMHADTASMGVILGDVAVQPRFTLFPTIPVI